MDWFNYYGLVIFVVLMIPNVIFFIKNKNGFTNKFDCKAIEYCEQAGRYGSFIFLIFNIPYLYRGFFFDCGETVYIIVNAILLGIYLLTWIIMWKKNNLTRALILSITPSIMFIFSGVMILSIPLIVFSIIFAVTHITISVKNIKK